MKLGTDFRKATLLPRRYAFQKILASSALPLFTVLSHLFTFPRSVNKNMHAVWPPFFFVAGLLLSNCHAYWPFRRISIGESTHRDQNFVFLSVNV